MIQALVITPVKDSLKNILETIKAINTSLVEIEYIVYNDFSSQETRDSLEKNAQKLRYKLINLEDLTNTPSPNYKLVLQLAQKLALEKNVPLIIVESDVTIKSNTFTQLLQFNNEHKNTGLVGAITVDSSGKVNFPYLKFKHNTDAIIETKRSLSFCCTLLSINFLKSFNFENLNQAKDWYDTIISKKAIELNFKNYVLMQAPVIHLPHSSRPWKHLKYKNPIKYYLLKLINKRDKI